MTMEQLSAKQASMSNADLIEKVETKITNLCRTGGKSFRMSVPPKVDDADMLLSEMVRRFKGTIFSTPTDTARAEDDLDLALNYLKDDGVRNDFFQDDGMVAYIAAHLANYAAPIRAEVERVRWEKELVMRQLSAANQRIAELEEQNKKYWFMIEHGLGVEDMTPPSYPHP